MKHIAVIVLLGVLMTGCAFTPHNANVEMKQPKPVSSTVAEGTTILLTVVDERDEPDLGRRGAGINVAKIRSEELFPKFTRVVEDGFRAKGYELTYKSGSADAKLVVALRTLKFEESAGFFTVGAEADATILAEAERGDDEYRNQYRSSDEDRQLAVSFGEGIDEQLSLVMNEVMEQLFSDNRLDSFLTGQYQ